jgi:oleate hydratase
MKAHLVGGGISSLAAAAYLFKDGNVLANNIKDGNVLANNIHVYEASDTIGGALDAAGDPEHGYSMRGGRMLEEHDPCMHELLSVIPSRSDSTKSIDEELRDFYRTHSWFNTARLIGEGGRAIDFSKLGLGARNLKDLSGLLLMPESRLDGKMIEDCLDLSIFQTNFWNMFGSIFAFLPWHSAIELRRYLLRFFHLLPTIGSMTTIQRTRYNQRQAIVEPLTEWLRRIGVNFHTGTLVTNVEFLPDEENITASALLLAENGKTSRVTIAPEDLVFVTNGSQVAATTRGTMALPPPALRQQDDTNWLLWERLARGRKRFGRPSAFNTDPAKSAWVTFTVTTHGPAFPEMMEKLTGSVAGRGGLITLTGSPWLMTINSFHHPHFIDQPPDVNLWWGYGLYVNRPGAIVRKVMPDCSGAEILTEVAGQLGLTDRLSEILATTNCIPCLLPYAGSVLLRRCRSDRPDVIPKRSVNLAFIGQFAEVEEEAVFTTEYAVRTAREAVAGLCKTRRPPPVYKGYRDLRTAAAALQTLVS